MKFIKVNVSFVIYVLMVEVGVVREERDVYVFVRVFRGSGREFRISNCFEGRRGSVLSFWDDVGCRLFVLLVCNVIVGRVIVFVV